MKSIYCKYKRRKNICTNKTILLYRCNEVSILQKKKKKKMLYGCTRIALKLLCCPEGKMCLFMWPFDTVSIKSNGSVE